MFMFVSLNDITHKMVITSDFVLQKTFVNLDIHHLKNNKNKKLEKITESNEQKRFLGSKNPKNDLLILN